MSSVFDIAIAAAGLDVVQLLVGAMRAVDASGPPIGRGATDGLSCSGSCDRPAAHYEPRLVIHRDPIYTRRQVIHPDPQFEPALHVAVPPPERIVEVVVEKSPVTQPPQAPWKSLPW